MPSVPNVPECTRRGRNTKSSPKRVSASLYWCFTFNNYTKEDLSTCLSVFKNTKDLKYIIGLEVGEKNKTEHLQGYIEMTNKDKKIRPIEFFDLSNKISWSHRYKESNTRSCIKYCRKDGVFATNFTDEDFGEDNLYLGEDLPTYENLYPWQALLIDKLRTKPDNRHVIWVWGGYNKGKTTIAKYIKYHLKASLVGGCSRDALFSITGKEKIIIIDVPKKGHIDFTLLEQLKAGLFYSTKYEGKDVIMNPPHVVVFSNKDPSSIGEEEIDNERFNIINTNV